MANEERENQSPRRRLPGLGEIQRGGGSPVEEEDLKFLKVPPAARPAKQIGNKAADLMSAQAIIDEVEREDIAKKPPPPLAYQVTSTYDSRFIQSYDFAATDCGIMEFNSDGVTPLTITPLTFTFTVPDNTIGVFRKLRYFLNPGVFGLGDPSDTGCWLRVDILSDDIPVREYNDERFGTFTKEAIDAFAIIDERRRLTVQFTDGDPMIVSPNVGAPLFTTGVQIFLYGQVIVKTGVPKEFDIANPT